MNILVAWPTFLTGVVCVGAVVTYVAKHRSWLGLGAFGAAGHFWAHTIVLVNARTNVTPGRLIGLFAVPVLWIVLVAAMAFLQPLNDAT